MKKKSIGLLIAIIFLVGFIAILVTGIWMWGNDSSFSEKNEISTESKVLTKSQESIISGCGNNVREKAEVCDGIDLNGQTCISKLGSGYVGTLSCKSDCSGYDTITCIREEEFKHYCTDSDGGENYEIFGIVSTRWGDGRIVSISDRCETQVNDKLLAEWYCLPENEVTLGKSYSYVHYTCPNSCLNGACI